MSPEERAEQQAESDRAVDERLTARLEAMSPEGRRLVAALRRPACVRCGKAAAEIGQPMCAGCSTLLGHEQLERAEFRRPGLKPATVASKRPGDSPETHCLLGPQRETRAEAEADLAARLKLEAGGLTAETERA